MRRIDRVTHHQDVRTFDLPAPRREVRREIEIDRALLDEPHERLRDVDHSRGKKAGQGGEDARSRHYFFIARDSGATPAVTTARDRTRSTVSSTASTIFGAFTFSE